MKDFAPKTGAKTRLKMARGMILAALAAIIPAAANAVDLENRDRETREVTVNHSNGDSRQLTVKGKQKVADICVDCVVLVGNTSVEVKGRETVKIERGKVSVVSK